MTLRRADGRAPWVDLSDQVVLVSGAGRIHGIGYACAHQLGRLGARVVAPGWIGTGSSSERELAMGRATPVGRPGTPAEVATAVTFLAAPAASYVTGHVLVVDGGNSVQEEKGA